MEKSTRPRGRPRSEASRKAILSAAYDLLQERGYAGMALELIAARAGVGKTTVYRWWPDRARLAIDAFFEATRDGLAFPDTGSVIEDFRRQIHQLAELLRSPAGAGFAAMIVGGQSDPELAAAIRERWVEPRMRWGRERLLQAQAEGECDPSLDVTAALQTLYGPLYAPLLLGLGVPAQAHVEAYLEIVFTGIFGDPQMRL